MNYSILTFITNNHEPVREIKNKQDNVEYILVTDDKNLKSDTWKVVYEPLLDTNKITGIAKTFLIKYNAHKYVSNDVFFRIDSQLEINESLDPIVEYFEQNHYDFMTMEHAYFDNFVDEYNAWENWRNHNPMWRERFYENTKDLGYDYNWKGLFGTTMSLCRKTDEVINFFEDMKRMMFLDDYSEVDNNDQCYTTVLLMTKYDGKINTWVTSWTILISKYISLLMHGGLEKNTYMDNIYNNELPWYWRGNLMGYIEPYEIRK